MTAHTINYILCDGMDCPSKAMIPENVAPEHFIPQRWMKVKAPSLEFVWEIVEYDFCSVACYMQVMAEVDELLSSWDTAAEVERG